jgi:hypothetical protein
MCHTIIFDYAATQKDWGEIGLVEYEFFNYIHANESITKTLV